MKLNFMASSYKLSVEYLQKVLNFLKIFSVLIGLIFVIRILFSYLLTYELGAEPKMGIIKIACSSLKIRLSQKIQIILGNDLIFWGIKEKLGNIENGYLVIVPYKDF